MKNPFRRRNSEQPEPAVESGATTNFHDQIESSDLPIALYLNQRMTFDVLASLEGGFSRFTTIQTTFAGESSTEMSGEAKLGVSNVFALLGVEFGGSRRTGQKRSESATEEIVHTPASLFARLRKDLRVRRLVHGISSSSDLKVVQPGEFVEFEATLRKSPFVELLSAFSVLVPLMELAEPSTDHTVTRAGRGKKTNVSQHGQAQDNTAGIKRQIDLFLSAVTAEGSLDLVAEVGEMRIILTAEPEYFIDPSMNDTIDGTFRVFGKATRTIPDDTEGISLLRKTALGKFGGIVRELGSAMASMPSSGFTGTVETEIRGPAMQNYTNRYFFISSCLPSTS